MLRPLLTLLLLAAPASADPRLDQYGDPLPKRAIVRIGTRAFRPTTEGRIDAAALSPDGKVLAVAHESALSLCDLATGRCSRWIDLGEESANRVQALRYSPDGKYLVALEASRLRVFDACTGKEQSALELREDARGIEFFPGSSKFALVQGDGAQSYIINAALHDPAKPFETDGYVRALAPSGRFYIGMDDGVPNLIDARTGRVGRRFEHPVDLEHAKFALTPDDKRFVSLTKDGTLRLFAADSAKLVESIPRPEGWNDETSASELTLAPDGAVAYLSDWRGCIHRRTLAASRWLDPITDFPDGSLFVHPNGKELVLAGSDGVIYRIDIRTREQVPCAHGLGNSPLAAPAPNGRSIAISSGWIRSRLELYDLAGKLLWSTVHSGSAGPPVWSADGRHVVCAGSGAATICDASTGKVLRSFRETDPEQGFTGAIAFSPDGQQLLAAMDHGLKVVAYDLKTGKRTGEWKPGLEFAIAFSPDGRTLSFENGSPGVALFDLETGRMKIGFNFPPPLRRGCGRGGVSASSIANRFSPDGSRVLSWTSEGLVVLWDSRNGEPNGLIETGMHSIECCAFSPDGLWLALGSSDGSASVWDIDRGQSIGYLKAHGSVVESIAFLPAGRLLTTSSDMTAVIWDISPSGPPTGAHWEALSGDDAHEAYRAAWAVAKDPKGPDLLRRRIAPAKPAASERVNLWLADLSADKYALRETATKELQSLGRLIEPDLHTARAKATSEEARTRLDALIAKIPRQRTKSEIVNARAVAALELSGSDAAKKLLAEWAAGAPGARLTVDARAALKRLKLSQR